MSVMPVPLKKLEDEAISLPARSRARLAERLIASLDGPTEPGAEVAWLAEAENRAKELASGKAKAVPATRVFRKARSMLR